MKHFSTWETPEKWGKQNSLCAIELLGEDPTEEVQTNEKIL